MVDFTLFRIRNDLADADLIVTDPENYRVVTHGPRQLEGFRATLHVASTSRQRPTWVEFLESEFDGAINWTQSTSRSALLVVEIENEEREGWDRFAFAFGPIGIHLIQKDVYVPRYGLITALNLIASGEGAPRLRAFDTTRHGASTLRSRLQTTAASGVEVFELDTLRDLVQKATGEPVDEQWGRASRRLRCVTTGGQHRF